MLLRRLRRSLRYKDNCVRRILKRTSQRDRCSTRSRTPAYHAEVALLGQRHGVMVR
jgi:hypothetical protein